jgi:GntR family transcriptional regulator
VNRLGAGGDWRQAASQLERTSFVPLYYQLQELLKEQIESGAWRPGDVLPSEPELARALGVSRAVVRQALAILEDDHQIRRIRGRGTFVAQPKLNHRVGGLSRLLVTPRAADVGLQVLDRRVATGGRRIRGALEVGEEEELLRLTTLLTLRGLPLAITYSFFHREQVRWLEAAAAVGRNLRPDLVLGDQGIELARSRASIEASQCGQFEAERFGVPLRSAVFLALCTELRRTKAAPRPFEVARVEYRGDLVQFQLELTSDAEGGGLLATWELSEQAVPPVRTT